jgi:hypothetical protein
MLSAYFDESGTHQDSPVCVVAGLVASPKQWMRFTPAWQKILDDFDIPEFHMKHFAHSVGPFRGWDQDRRDKLMRRLIPLIQRVASYRVWTAIVMEDYRGVFEDDDHLFSLCAFGCASRLKWLARQRGDHFYIPYMFEHGGTGSSRAFQSFNNLLARGRADFYRMGPLSVGERRKSLPLQAADLHAYEVFKYFADQLSRSQRGVRKSYQELMRIPEAGGYLMTWDKLRALLKGIKEQGLESEDTIPIPVDPLNLEKRVLLKKG